MTRLTLSPEELEIIRIHREKRMEYVKGWNHAIDKVTETMAEALTGQWTTHQVYDKIVDLKMDL